MKIFMFEGTPQEMKELKGMGVFDFKVMDEVSVREPFSQEFTSNKAAEALTEECVALMLTRNGGLTATQRAVVKAIYDQGKEGISSMDIAKTTKCAPSRIKATMRTIGKRVAHTHGWPTGIRAFNQTWTGTQNVYCLHPVMRKLIDNGTVKL